MFHMVCAHRCREIEARKCDSAEFGFGCVRFFPHHQPRSSPCSSPATASAPLSSLPPTSTSLSTTPSGTSVNQVSPLFHSQIRITHALATSLTISRVAFRLQHRARRRARTISAQNCSSSSLSVFITGNHSRSYPSLSLLPLWLLMF